MSRIVIAFGHNASREKISFLVEQCGHSPKAVCRSGAEVIREVHRMGAGVVICGYKLTDMTGDQLAANLEGLARIMVVASAANLEMLEYPHARHVTSPISRSAFKDTLEELIALDDEFFHAHIPKRSAEETALIDAAKAILVRRGMTEAEAHSYLQQRSMRNRCKLTVTAHEIVSREAKKAP